MFLGVTAEFEGIAIADSDKTKTFQIHLIDNPLNDFVELPEHLKGLNYT